MCLIYVLEGLGPIIYFGISLFSRLLPTRFHMGKLVLRYKLDGFFIYLFIY